MTAKEDCDSNRLALFFIFFYCIITRMQPKAMARYIHFGQSKFLLYFLFAFSFRFSRAKYRL